MNKEFKLVSNAIKDPEKFTVEIFFGGDVDNDGVCGFVLETSNHYNKRIIKT